ncbi:MAG: class I SAM-dependent methyltransferase [Cyclobacteriaceae bacterium]
MSIPWTEPLGGGTIRKVKQLSLVVADNKVLDFGAGFGRYSDLFSNIVGQDNTYLVEVDSDSILELREKGYKNIYEPESAVLPYEDDYFDVIFSSNVLEHISRPEYFEYLKEIHRVLKPGKRFVVGIPSYPFKRVFDISKAIQTGMYKYYLLDDPTHINKMNIITFEKHLSKLYDTVCIEPTKVLFEDSIPYIKKNRMRFRFMADKVMGYCIK